MSKYLDIPQDASIESTTCFRENEDGQPIIQTDMAEVMNLTEDPGTHGLALGRAIRGSMRLVSLGNGRYGIRARPFQHDSEAAIRQTQENIASTEHGQCYRTARQTKLVFTFPRNISFEKLLDLLDDECWDLKQTLEKEAASKEAPC